MKDRVLSFLKKYYGEMVFLVVAIICGGYIYAKYLSQDSVFLFSLAASDTLNAYFPFTSYFKDWVESGFPLWSFSLGLGATIFSIPLVLLDPFNIFYLFVTPEESVYLVPILMVAKLVLAGFFFFKLLKEAGANKLVSVSIALFYSFSAFAIVWGHHYFFATPILFVSLVGYAAERSIGRGKHLMFVVCTALFAACSFYTFYMFCFFFIFYSLFRLVVHSGDIKTFLIKSGKHAAFFAAGILISLPMMLPQLMAIADGGRVGSIDIWAELSNILSLSFNEMKNIRMLLPIDDAVQKFSYPGFYEQPLLYCGAIAFIASSQIPFVRGVKNKVSHILFFAFTVLMVYSDFFPRLFNAFSNATYRFAFLFVFGLLFVAGVCLGKAVEERAINLKSLFTVGILLVVGYTRLSGLNLADIDFSALATDEDMLRGVVLVFSAVAITVLLAVSKIKLKAVKYIASSLVIVVAMFEVSAVGRSLNVNVSELENNDFYYDDSYYAIETLDSDEFSRLVSFDKTYTVNDSLISGYNGMDYYSSVQSASYIALAEALGANRHPIYPNYVAGLSVPLDFVNLCGVNYKVGDASSVAYKLYGSERIGIYGGSPIYENNYAFPLGFVYTNSVGEESVSDINKALIMNHTAITKDESESNYNLYETNILPITLFDNNADNATFKAYSETDGYTSLSTGNPKLSFDYNKTNYSSSFHISFDFTAEVESEMKIYYGEIGELGESIPVDYGEIFYTEGENKMEFTFTNCVFERIWFEINGDPEGTNFDYSIENFKVVETNYFIGEDNLFTVEQALEMANNSALEISSFRDDEIHGDISVKEDGILFFSIPYSDGWSLYLNGEETETYIVNYGFIGADVAEGEYQVHLIYRPQYFGLTLVLSISTFIAVLILIFHKRLLFVISKIIKVFSKR